MQISVIQKPHHLVTNSHPPHTYIYTWRKEKKGNKKNKAHNKTKQNKQTYKLQTLEQKKNLKSKR
jgi:hypothetical protein